ncbi:uncharacterized protein TNCV_1002691 [Trichonephila clavipes]|nr:uncharacterized protein TNCV_1002691 [Trichonephila clavipes]
MGKFMNAENTDMNYMYGRTNGNDKAALRMCHVQFPVRRKPDHRIFQRLHRQFRETRSFYVTRHDAGRRRTVRSPSLEENTLNVVVDRFESSTRAVAHHVSVSHQTIRREFDENRLHLFHFHLVPALKPADYLLRLPVGGTAMSAAAGLHNLCAEQLL